MKSDSLLSWTASSTDTALWVDGIIESELRFGLDRGAVGATSNPIIALNAIREEAEKWDPVLKAAVRDFPDATEDEIGWRVVERMTAERSTLFLPAFQRSGGRDGRISIQTDPRLFRSAERMVEQAERFSVLAPNIVVKIPATSAGLAAIEEATSRGISTNATVSFSVAQAIAVGEAVERGLKRKRQNGESDPSLGPVCTIMIGRLDDFLGEMAGADSELKHELQWAGICVFKRAYQWYVSHGYTTRLLAAAFRSTSHFTELVGADVVLSPPHKWATKIDEIAPPYKKMHAEVVNEDIVSRLASGSPEFRRAYEPAGMRPAEFDGFGPTVTTLRQFSEGCAKLARVARNHMLR